ncbi:hypothetical protein [Nocardia sp. R7R-8]|uniref:hypothetical protein n=1 Tax=Nocardia sp. R7R-8 TaxID=3459304 RepID=UPI00403DD837
MALIVWTPVYADGQVGKHSFSFAQMAACTGEDLGPFLEALTARESGGGFAGRDRQGYTEHPLRRGGFEHFPGGRIKRRS